MARAPRRRFVKTCSALRGALPAHSRAEAASVRLAYAARGNPWPVRKIARSDLHSSVSHASDRAIITVSRSTLASDIERFRAIRDMDGLSPRFWTRREA